MADPAIKTDDSESVTSPDKGEPGYVSTKLGAQIGREAPKSWTEIEVDPRYRHLAPAQRAQFRERFFDTQVLPKLSEKFKLPPSKDNIDSFRKAFDRYTRETPAKYGDDMDAALKGDLGILSDVDYFNSPVSMNTLRKFFEADNDRERYLTLSNIYGKSNVAIDPGGRWYIKDKDGKKYAVLGMNAIKELGAKLASEGPEIAGMMIGGALAPESGGVSLVPYATRFTGLAAKLGIEKPAAVRAIANAVGKTVSVIGGTAERAVRSIAKSTPQAVGAAGGKIAQEAGKVLSGEYAKTPGEEFRAVGKEAAGALFGDLGFRGMSKFGQRWTLDLYSHGATAAEKAYASRALREGFMPSVAQATGESKQAPLWRYSQSLYDLVFGGGAKRNAQNFAAINRKLDSYLDSIGVPQDKWAEFKRRITAKDTEISDAKTKIGVPIEQKFKALNDDVNAVLDTATRSLSTDIDRMAKESGATSHPVLAVDLEESVSKARVQLGNLATAKYGQIWAMGGEDGLNAPTSGIKQRALELWDDILKTARPEVRSALPTRKWTEVPPGSGKFRWVMTEPTNAPEPKVPGTAVNARLDAFKKQIERIMDLPSEVPMQKLAGLRTDFYNIAEDNTLTPGVEKARFRDLAESITQTFNEMERMPGVPSDAAKALRETNKWYADEIGKFDIMKVARLARDPGTMGALTAEGIPSALIRPGETTTVDAVKRVVGDDVWNKIAGTRFAEIKNTAIDPKTGEFDPAKFAAELGKFTKDGFARKVWGDARGAEIERLQKEAAVLGEYIDPKTLTPGTIRESIAAAVAKKKQVDAYWSENLMSNLAKGGVDQEKAIERVAAMQNLSDIRQIKAFFGADSAQFKAVQQLALQRLLGRAIKIQDSPFGAPLTGGGLSGELAAVGKDKLEEMFGRDMAEDLSHLSDMIRYVTAKGGNTLAGALRAGELMFHPISHLPAIIQSVIEGKLMSTPGFIRWITMGLEGDGRAVRYVAAATRLATFTAGQELAKHIDGEPQEYNVAP